MEGQHTNATRAAPPRFVHLHLHTEYSLLDGGNRIDLLLDRVRELGMDSVAVTDHGNLHAAVEFHDAAREAGIKPILGIEAYVAPDREGRPGDRRERVQTGVQDGGFHLVLLARTMAGWRNLMRLSSDAFLNGFYYRPRMDKSTLREHREGLIAINGHLGSSIAHHLCLFARTGGRSHWEDACAEARWHAQNFGPDEQGEPCFYIELQRHVSAQEEINPHLVRLAAELGLPLICDNDAHFLRREDQDSHDTLCCISMGKTKESPDRLRYSEELFVKSPQEMAELFADHPEAIENALRVAERCSVELPKGERHAPLVRVRGCEESPPPPAGDLTAWFRAYCARFEVLPFDAAEGEKACRAAQRECDEALRRLCEAGLTWRYGTGGATPQIRARLDRELAVLSSKAISAYFLIVWDFVSWAHSQGIPATARGSGVGTMVGFVLGLSNACPERYGLLFERFTDPDRSEYPDIDIDICQVGRQRVLEHVRRKYGHVAQIITFGRLKARAAIKDVARVMGLSPDEGQRLANLVPAELNITIEEALDREPRLREAVEQDGVTRRVIDHAIALEDHARHAGVHAGGVVIATQPLDTIVPLCRVSGGEEAVTQWDGPTCERVGLLKMDFLGLRTLSTIELCRKLVRESMPEESIWRAVGRGGEWEGKGPKAGAAHPLDLDRINLADDRVLALFRRADTGGVFQFESGGMRRLLKDMQPDRLEDLIAANALFRPGPMDLISEYVERKHGRRPVPPMHPEVARFAGETYGIMVYQEQVMQILHHLGGVPLRQAYTVIKAISKKKVDVIDGARTTFLEGAAARGMQADTARELFEQILKFAGYGFNKSHSTSYAIVAYQTAYLKTYFPNQYMAAVLSFESQAHKVEEWSIYLEECRRAAFPDSTPQRPHVGVEVLPPEVNLSDADFAVVYREGEPRDNLHGHVRFGLKAIKGAGEGAIAAILAARGKGQFRDFFEFCERVDLRAVNRATIEALIKAGAFDASHGVEARSALAATLDDAMRAGQAAAQDRRDGQMSMFGGDERGGAAVASPAPALRRTPPWERLQALAYEKEALGFHVSGHPLDEFRAELETFCSADSRTIGQLPSDAPVVFGCILGQVRTTQSKRGREPGRPMAMVTLEDSHGATGAVLFPETYAKYAEALVPGRALAVAGHVDRSRAEPGILVERIVPLEDASAHLAMGLEVVLERAAGAEQALQMLVGELRRAAGTTASLRGRPVEVLLRVPCSSGVAWLAPHGIRVVPDRALLSSLDRLLPGAIAVRGGYLPPARRRPEHSFRRHGEEEGY